MFEINYEPMEQGMWQGRIDSNTNYDAFRWHQWVKSLDLRDEKLSVYGGKLGFAFIGFCCDEGVRRNLGRTGAANGPQSIRKEMSNLPCLFTQEVALFDAGNIYCEGISLEESQAILAKAVEKILSLKLFPIVLGGGHETAFGNYCGILSHLSEKHRDIGNKPDIGIINFDAHFDLRPYPNGGSSGTMFRQIADISADRGLKYSYFCLGIQRHSNTVDLFKTADRLGVRYIMAKDMIHHDDWTILEQLDYFMKSVEQVYLTICSDVFSTSFAPGVSASQSLGIDPESVLKYLKYILRTGKVAGFDICEVSPRFDQDNTTSDLASVIIFALVNTIAQIFDLAIS